MSTIFVKGNTELFCPSIFSVIQRAHQCHQPHDPAPHVWSRPQVPHPPSAHLHHVGWSPGPCVRYVSVQKLELFISCQTQHNITSVGLVFLAVWICTVNLTADRKITYLQNTLWGWAIILLATESCHTHISVVTKGVIHRSFLISSILYLQIPVILLWYYIKH